MRIVFMGSPEVAVPSLEKLVDDGYDIVAVYTQPDRPAGRGRKTTPPPVKRVAQIHGIPVEQPETLKHRTAVERLKSWKPDVIIVCAYGKILTQDILDVPGKQCLNVHFSLLPRHRGATPATAAILEGDEFTGVSVQLVRLKLDTGPVIASAAIPVLPYDTTGLLMEKLSVVGAGMISEALGGWLRGERNPLEQDESKATYICQIKKEEGEIDWSEPAVKIWSRVRAYYPWPGSYSTWKGKKLKITRAELFVAEAEMPVYDIGQVVKLDGGIGVQTGDGIINILRVQPEGRKEMTAAEYLCGQRDIIGAVLPS